MNETEGTTPAPKSATPDATVGKPSTSTCPSWCTREDSHEPRDLRMDPIKHTGPTFGTGRVVARQWDDGEPGDEIHVVVEDFEFEVENATGRAAVVGALRELGESALAAADWLEAQR